MVYKLNAVRILVVDDMQPMLDLTKTVLSLFGFQHIYTANNAEDAFSLSCTKEPDLIITDWVMKDMDGLQLAKKIRTDERSPDPFVPIIMMTGYSSKLRVEAARDAGITEFLVKPFTSDDLYRRVHQIIEKPRQFVKSGEFFGPDRRRKLDIDFDGPEKRTEFPEGAEDDRYSDEFKSILNTLKEEARKI